MVSSLSKMSSPIVRKVGISVEKPPLKASMSGRLATTNKSWAISHARDGSPSDVYINDDTSGWNSAVGRPTTVTSNNIESLGGWARKDDYEFKLLPYKSLLELRKQDHFKVLKYKDAFYMGQVQAESKIWEG
jgi:hypothetical protein